MSFRQTNRGGSDAAATRDFIDDQRLQSAL